MRESHMKQTSKNRDTHLHTLESTKSSIQTRSFMDVVRSSTTQIFKIIVKTNNLFKSTETKFTKVPFKKVTYKITWKMKNLSFWYPVLINFLFSVHIPLIPFFLRIPLLSIIHFSIFLLAQSELIELYQQFYRPDTNNHKLERKNFHIMIKHK